MNDIAFLKKFFITDKSHRKDREPTSSDLCSIARSFAARHLSAENRAAELIVHLLDCEKPMVYPFERIAFSRTIKEIPSIFTPEEEKKLHERFHIHEHGAVCNISVDYTKILLPGLSGKIRELEFLVAGSTDGAKIEFWRRQIGILSALVRLVTRYRDEARRVGNVVVDRTLSALLERAPHSFAEALQLFRIIHFTMWLGGNYHNTIGHFDQYMLPYYKHDIENGILNKDEALNLLEEFFLTFNRDSDLYPGMQQGDNGQSLVLGGYKNGKDLYNDLSELCILASLKLKLIDPKINLRVSKQTGLERYVLGTKMTMQGLGFPQYSSDDIVIKGLIDLGYDPEDASEYVVAACWEFIIPGKAMDIPNLLALSFAETVRKAVEKNLAIAKTYEELFESVKKEIKMSLDDMLGGLKPVYIYPAPFISLMMEGCTEAATDISLGCKYNNYGIHGTGIATAVDSLASVKKHCYDDKDISPKKMLDLINGDFSGDEVLGNRLRYGREKFGNDTPLTNGIAAALLDAFSTALKGRHNERGGIFRGGTGSAMYYVWHSSGLGATPDGRRKGDAIPANYSPSLFAKIKGPLSVIKSFASPDLTKVVNGGPLTIELHDSLFQNSESIEKVARLIKYFFDIGGHQLQINTVNRETLLDAQKHPEKYRNLIVRVWGWSGYFVELDKCYQDHIIKRIEFKL